MAQNTTQYDVRVALRAEGARGVRAIFNDIGNSVDPVEKRLKSIRNMLAAPWIARGVGLAKSSLIDFNAEVESARTGLSAMLAMNLHIPFDRAKVAANSMFATFQEMAKKSPSTTKDFIDMAQAITGSVLAFGGSLRDVEALTQGGVIAGEVFGIRSDMMGLDIQQALAGSLGKRDKIAQIIRASSGLDNTAFNKKGETERFEILKKALTDPAIKAAADEYANSYAGQLSTFKDNLQLTLGKIGLPLFKRISAELQKWNAWIDANPKKVEKFAKTASDLLVGGFTIVKDTFAFIIEHHKILLGVAGAFGAGKMIHGLANIGLAPGRGSRDEFGKFIAGTTTNLQKFSAGLQLAAVGAAGFYTAYLSVRDALKDDRSPNEIREQELKNEYIRKHGRGILPASTLLFGGTQAEYSGSSKDDARVLLEARRFAKRTMGAEQFVQRTIEGAKKFTDEAATRALFDQKGAGKGSDVNVTVNINRVQSEHPDRFAQGLTRTARKVARNPTQADTAWDSAAFR